VDSQWPKHHSTHTERSTCTHDSLGHALEWRWRAS